MLKVAGQAPVNVIKSEQRELKERKNLPNPYQFTMATASRDSSKKRWMRVRDSLTLAKIKVALNDSIFSPGTRRPKNFPKQPSSSAADMHSSGSARQQRCRSSGNEWTDAFDALIRDPEGRLQFTKFLESEYSEENILFWWAVEELHAVDQNGGHLVEMAQDIYNTFVASDSPLAINIDHDTRAEITERVEHQDVANYTLDIFDKAQSHVYRLMEKDCFSRFVQKDVYKELSKRLKLPETFRFTGSV